MSVASRWSMARMRWSKFGRARYWHYPRWYRARMLRRLSVGAPVIVHHVKRAPRE